MSVRVVHQCVCAHGCDCKAVYVKVSLRIQRPTEAGCVWLKAVCRFPEVYVSERLTFPVRCFFKMFVSESRDSKKPRGYQHAVSKRLWTRLRSVDRVWDLNWNTKSFVCVCVISKYVRWASSFFSVWCTRTYIHTHMHTHTHIYRYTRIYKKPVQVAPNMNILPTLDLQYIHIYARAYTVTRTYIRNPFK